MTLTYERLLLSIGGTFTAFCIFSVLFGETAALWLARITAIAGLVTLVAYAVTHAAGTIKRNMKSYGYEAKKAAIELKKMEKEADAAGFEVHRLHGPGMMLAVDQTGETPMISNFGYHPDQAAVNMPGEKLLQAAQSERHPPLLPVLTALDRALIVAGMGSGKSELLKWIALDAAENRGGDVFIIDSHASPDTWPIKGVNVVGIGRDYGQIEATVNYICDQMDQRYKQRSTGKKKRFHPVTLIIDELTVLHQFTDLKQQFKSLLCECRKVNIRLFMAGQSDRANALGLKGNNDLRAGFESIVYLKKQDQNYLAEVFAGTSKTPETFVHPGIFGSHPVTLSRCHTLKTPVSHRDRRDKRDTVTGVTGINYQPGRKTTPPQNCIFESQEEKQIVEMHRAGYSLSKIAETVWGARNGRRTNRIKEIIKKYDCLVKINDDL